jgi:hypothetical protein
VWITPLKGKLHRIGVIIINICSDWQLGFCHICGHGVGMFWSCVLDTLLLAFNVYLRTAKGLVCKANAISFGSHCMSEKGNLHEGVGMGIGKHRGCQQYCILYVMGGHAI